MPLIRITSKPAYSPDGGHLAAISYGRKTVSFGQHLPHLFVSNKRILRMDPDTVETAVQVSHRMASTYDVNAPDIWLLIEFSEGDLTDEEQTEVTGEVKKLIIREFAGIGFPAEFDHAVDVRWNPSHGFLSIGGTKLDW